MSRRQARDESLAFKGQPLGTIPRGDFGDSVLGVETERG